MGWIDIHDRMPPEGLEVLLEVSGQFTAQYGVVADHNFYIGSWIVPHGKTDGNWLLWDNSNGDTEGRDGHLYDPIVHAWMPMPEHFAPKEMGFEQDPDLMEHSIFEDDPEWLYKGDYVYEPGEIPKPAPKKKKKDDDQLEGQMSIEDWNYEVNV